jgi:linoleoyl-CoA desaturase
MSAKLKFLNSNKSTFFATVRERVDEYFIETGYSKYANKAMWGKTIFYMAGFLGLYFAILSNQFGLWTMFGLCLMLGIFCAFIGFNIFHNVVHHTYTNIPGHDEDIEIAPGLIRLANDEKVNKIQRFQHYYAIGVYSLASLSWVFRKDYLKFFQKKIGQHPTLKHPKKEYFNLFFYKAVYYFLFIVLPLMILDITWWQLIIGFLGLHFAEGLVLGLVFQLAHVVEGTDFPEPNDQGNIEEAWANHQMHTTANFATKSKIAAFLLGGLNRQIEHHLFPKVCHIHYPAISAIVKQTTEEFNLPYIESVTFLDALRSHYRMLKHYGHEAYYQQLQPVTVPS